jgi:hypothetical protein
VLRYRVTRYDPALRDAAGHYTVATWTSIADVGRAFEGRVLEQGEYLRVEDAYVSAAEAFLDEAGAPLLTALGVENDLAHPDAPREGQSIPRSRTGEIVRALLREDYWCRLEGPGAYVHVGRDLYLYVGVPIPCPGAIRLARECGLFVEELASPYLDE